MVRTRGRCRRPLGRHRKDHTLARTWALPRANARAAHFFHRTRANGTANSEKQNMSTAQTTLDLYDNACRAIAAAKNVDEAKQILDISVAMRAYARQARNRDMEADAIEIRMRATRRLDQLVQAQKKAVGLASGGEHGGRGRKIDGLRENPSIMRPTLAMQGIDKNLAHQARVLGALSDEKFEQTIADARDGITRAVKRAVAAAADDVNV